MVSNANYLIGVFINFHENMKNGRKNLKKSINELISAPNSRCDTFFLFNIEPVMSYDEFIGDVVLFENYLIRIFMNIHKTVKKWEKTRENISIAMYWIGYKM